MTSAAKTARLGTKQSNAMLIQTSVVILRVDIMTAHIPRNQKITDASSSVQGTEKEQDKSSEGYCFVFFFDIPSQWMRRRKHTAEKDINQESSVG